MNTKHTPGPWRVSRQEFRRHGGQAVEGVVPVVRMQGPCDAVVTSLGCPAEEAEANARLIAAAPELLDELRRTQDLLFGLLDYFEPGNELQAINAQRARNREVIAKATNTA